MNQAQVHELLYQALETELGGIHVYQTALQCTVNADLTQEWQKYLEQTETHAEVLRELFATLRLNPTRKRRDGRWSAISGTRWSPPWRWL